MKVKLAYGKTGLDVELPGNLNISVIELEKIKGLPDEEEAITTALQNPIGTPSLNNLAERAKTAGIIFNDITRATPYKVILPPLLKQLDHIPDRKIILFNATGTHRENTEEELISILGKEIFRRFKIIQNNCRNKTSYQHIGTTASGNEIEIISAFMDCDVKILTGFIEPHFFAGFSGGGKAVMPGIASLETIMRNHKPENIAHPMAHWGITEGNPVWEEITEAAYLARPDFLLNVAMNKEKRVTKVFAGDFILAHREGCKFVRKNSMIVVDEPFDIVITSNSGFPLDLNVYQSVKGMSAAFRVVKKGGSIIIAAECWDGIPDHGSFRKILEGAGNAEKLYNSILSSVHGEQDLWQAQIMAEICKEADVYLYSHLFDDEETLNRIKLKKCPGIEHTLKDLLKKYGTNAKIGILPEGPLTIPCLIN